MYLSSVKIAILCIAVAKFADCQGQIIRRRNAIQEFLQLDVDSQHEFVKIEFVEPVKRRNSSRAFLPAGTRMRLRAFGTDINLWLHPRNSRLAKEGTPIYFIRYARKSPRNVKIVKNENLMRSLCEVLEDPKHLASIVIGEDHFGKVTVNGRIDSKKLIVRSLPQWVVDEYAMKHHPINIFGNYSTNLTHHVVYTIHNSSDEQVSFNAVEDTLTQSRLHQSFSPIPKIIYPRLLVVVHYTMYSVYRKDMKSFLEYLLAFFNAVDLKYRAFRAPGVRFHISGILIGGNARGIPYIAKNMASDEAFHAEEALKDSTSFFYNIRQMIPLSSYHIAITLTRLAFGLNKSAGVLGKAYVSTACKNFTNHGKMLATAIVRDNGAFSGTAIAAHELGHVLGMDHDVCVTEECRAADGFIMAGNLVVTQNTSTFSPCSLAAMQSQIERGAIYATETPYMARIRIRSGLLNYLNYSRIDFSTYIPLSQVYPMANVALRDNITLGKFCDEGNSEKLSCMYEKPEAKGRRIPHLMPGRILGLEKQCLLNGYTSPCNITDENICVSPHCIQGDGTCKKLNSPTLDGTSCSGKDDPYDRFCVHSRCVRVDHDIWERFL